MKIPPDIIDIMLKSYSTIDVFHVITIFTQRVERTFMLKTDSFYFTPNFTMQ